MQASTVWPDDVPQPDVTYRTVTIWLPGSPEVALYDGTVIKAKKPRKILERSRVARMNDPPPTGRKWPRGLTGWKLAGLMLLMFPVFPVFGAFSGDFYPPTVSSVLTTLPFVDASDPTWNIPTGGVTNATTAIQAMITASGAAAYYFPQKTYGIATPVKWPGGSYVQCAGWGRWTASGFTGSGTCFQLLNDGASWVGRGVFESTDYTSSSNVTTVGDPVMFRDFNIDGAGGTNGSGLIIFNSRTALVDSCAVQNFKGTAAWNTGGGGQQTGTGVGVVLTTNCFNGTAQATQNPVDPTIFRVRARCNNNRFVLDDTGGAGNISDGQMVDCDAEIQYTTSVAHDVNFTHSNGWFFVGFHSNGSGGDTMHLLNADFSQIYGGNYDGWGIGTANGGTNYCLFLQFSTGNLSSGNIGPLRTRMRDTQSTAGASYVWCSINLANGGSASQATVQISGVSGFNKVGATDALLTLWDFNPGNNASSRLYIVCDGNVWMDSSGAPLADARIFTSTTVSTKVFVYGDSNSWNSGAAAPTTGSWPTAYQRTASAPALGAALSFTATAGGSPGTWAEQTLMTMRQAYVVNDVTVATSAFADATGLSFAVAANEVWAVEYFLTFTTAGTAGANFQLTGPASPTHVEIMMTGPNTAVTNSRWSRVTGFSSASGTGFLIGAAASAGMIITATVQNGANAGTVQLQFNSINNTDNVTVRGGSHMIARRIA